MKLIVSLLFIFLALQPAVSNAGTEEDVWKKLKQGGMVVLLRHAAIVKENDPLLRDPSCLKERKLSAKGKKDAVMIGKTFVAKGVVINEVLTSPYCRTTDTATLAFGKVHPIEFLSVLEAFSREQAEVNTERLLKKIGSYSGKGNLVLVTHGPNINAVSFDMIEIGAFIVLQPMGDDEFEELGKINLTR